MPAVLAIDTATDACSVALSRGGDVIEEHRVIPRAHNRHILAMIDGLCGGQSLEDIDVFACGLGPGSFTGLRIATSVIQGLAWSLEKPVLTMCSLELQTRSAISRAGSLDGSILSVIDAQIGQVYWRWFHLSADTLVPVSAAQISRPADIKLLHRSDTYSVIGSGAGLKDAYCTTLQNGVDQWLPDVRPHAGELARWGSCALASSTPPPLISAMELSPDYVQQSIGWKKLSEQPHRV